MIPPPPRFVFPLLAAFLVGATGACQQQTVDPVAPREQPERSGPSGQLIPRAVCWSGVREINDLESLTLMLGAALTAGDPKLMAYLEDRLAELIGDDGDLALRVVALAENANDGSLRVYFGALKKARAGQLPKVANALIGMAERHSDPSHRARALAALEAQKKLDTPALDRLTALAKDNGSNNASWSATRTIGRVMANDYRSGGNIRPYIDRLMNIASTSKHQPTRQLAVEMPVYPEPVLDDDVLESLGRVLLHDSDKDIRMEAALVLSSVRDTAGLLKLYQQAFLAEKDRCVRWIICQCTARAGGRDALPQISGYASIDPRFEPDYHQLKAVFDSGMVDWERIILELEPKHPCVGDMDEPVDPGPPGEEDMPAPESAAPAP